MVEEPREGGWSAVAVVEPFEPSLEATMEFAAARGLSPGAAVCLRLVRTDQQLTIEQSWPSVVRHVRSARGMRTDECAIAVYLGDPVTALGGRRIWGAFAGVSPARIAGGALSLAVGGDGVPTRTPALPGMPSVVIGERLRESIRHTPYAIAAGTPMKLWLYNFLARLGVRMEFAGTDGGQVRIDLRDGESGRTGIQVSLADSGELSETAMRIADLGYRPASPLRASVLDSPQGGHPFWIGDGRSAGNVIEAAEITRTEAQYRAFFDRQREVLEATPAAVQSARPGLHPGDRLDFRQGDIDGSRYWQVTSVTHYFTIGGYVNSAEIRKADLAWRPPVLHDEGALMVSAVVDDGASAPGTEVARDNRGRIPVRFGFLAPVEGEGDMQPPSPSWTGSRVSLPVVAVAGGSGHSTLYAHRQGDPCRVSVQSAVQAEIIGFCYRDHQRVDKRFVDRSAGIVVQREGDAWSGVVFRPSDDLDTSVAAGDAPDEAI